MSVFEGFSDAAKAAMVAAHADSRRLGAPATGPLHLLLGALITNPGVATVFADLGVTAAQVESFTTDGAEPIPVKQRPDQWSPTGRRVLEMSVRERLLLQDPVIEVEHLAMAVTSESCDETVRIVQSLGASLVELRARLLRRLGHSGMEPAPPWPGSVADRPVVKSDRGGCSTPEEVALQGFAPDAGAHVVAVRYNQPNHATVQVGFPGKGPSYYLNIFRHSDGWRRETPEGRDI